MPKDKIQNPVFMDWKIKLNHLAKYKAGGWTEDFFRTTPDAEYGILIYNIDEWRMGAYGGLFAIFSNKKRPILELNSSETWINFQNNDSFCFLENSDCLVFRLPFLYQEVGFKEGFPFLLLQIKKKRFAFYDFDISSPYYNLKDLGKNKAEIIEQHPLELQNMEAKSRKGEIIDFDQLQWFDLNEFDRASEKYQELF